MDILSTTTIRTVEVLVILFYRFHHPQEFLAYLYPGIAKIGADVFFTRQLLVAPNQFRAPRKGEVGDSWMLDHETKCLKEILEASNDLRKVVMGDPAKDAAKDPAKDPAKQGDTAKTAVPDLQKGSTSSTKLQLTDADLMEEDAPTALEMVAAATTDEQQNTVVTKENSQLSKAFINLQEKVNVYLDSSKGATKAETETKGIKQKLEKKQGLFRMKMMGKRVNYAGRSVISPEPNLETNEIGVPVFMCKVLGFPEKVWAGNCAQMEQLVINGNEHYPGASQAFEPQANGRYRTRDLGKMKREERVVLAKKIRSGHSDADVGMESTLKMPFIVYRHLTDGDPVLMNRQPTLHKPGIMTQIVKVLQKERTLRFHYANCNTYNADFDGDEMNMHAPQDIQGRMEALKIAQANKQYESFLEQWSGRVLCVCYCGADPCLLRNFVPHCGSSSGARVCYMS